MAEEGLLPCSSDAAAVTISSLAHGQEDGVAEATSDSMADKPSAIGGGGERIPASHSRIAAAEATQQGYQKAGEPGSRLARSRTAKGIPAVHGGRDRGGVKRKDGVSVYASRTSKYHEGPSAQGINDAGVFCDKLEGGAKIADRAPQKEEGEFQRDEWVVRFGDSLREGGTVESMEVVEAKADRGCHEVDTEITSVKGNSPEIIGGSRFGGGGQEIKARAYVGGQHSDDGGEVSNREKHTGDMKPEGGVAEKGSEPEEQEEEKRGRIVVRGDDEVRHDLETAVATLRLVLVRVLVTQQT